MNDATDQILVSVCMITYNHELYIRKAIESIINQRTNFKFELLIHDDASTDATAKIIQEYEKKYPDIIRTVLQTENQWSKGKKIVASYLLPMVRGKYYAFCEGDDFWTDELKLQKQADFLETNPDIPAVSNRYYIVNKNGEVTGISHKGEKLNRVFNKADAIRLGASTLHPNTVMIRTNIVKDENYLNGKERCCILGGHTFMIYYLASIGGIYIIEDVMGAWRCVIEKGNMSYASRNARHPITYTVKLLDMYCRYRDFFGDAYDFSDRIDNLSIQAVYNIIFEKENHVNRIQELKKVNSLLSLYDKKRCFRTGMKKIKNRLQKKVEKN